jgi:hypothetical protein
VNNNRAVGIAAFGCVGYHRQPVAGGGLEVQCKLAEEPLHAQQGSDVGFVVNKTRHVQELMQAAAAEFVGFKTCPRREGGVDFRYAPIRSEREITTRGVLKQIPVVGPDYP